MIQLDRSGKVLRHDQTGSGLARVDRDAAPGRGFFDEVAPGTRVRELHGSCWRAPPPAA